jgi:hypothetical protein
MLAAMLAGLLCKTRRCWSVAHGSDAGWPVCCVKRGYAGLWRVEAMLAGLRVIALLLCVQL